MQSVINEHSKCDGHICKQIHIEQNGDECMCRPYESHPSTGETVIMPFEEVGQQ